MPCLARACLAEFLGVFFLTFVGIGAIVTTGGKELVVIALAHGLALSAGVYASGHISGGHLNPAITAAMLATKRIRLGGAVAYVAAQLAGAVVAAFAIDSLLDPSSVAAVHLGATRGSLTAEATAWRLLVLEAVLAFLLATTIFAVAVDTRGPKNVYGFAIGAAVTFDILFAGPLTGASMNPARSFGPAFVTGDWALHLYYWAGPILGACAAGLLYDGFLIGRKTAREEPQDD